MCFVKKGRIDVKALPMKYRGGGFLGKIIELGGFLTKINLFNGRMSGIFRRE